MLGSCRHLLTAGIIVLLVSQAFGQRVALQPGGFGGYDRLLLEDSVQKELKLTDEQITKIKEVIRSLRQRHQGDLDKVRTLPAAEKSVREKEILKTISQEVLKDVGGTLKPEQTRDRKSVV